MIYTVKDNLLRLLRQADEIWLQNFQVWYGTTHDGNIYFYDADHDRDYGAPEKILTVHPDSTFELVDCDIKIYGRVLTLMAMTPLKPDTSELK